MDDLDTGEQDFDGNKICLENISNGNYSQVEFSADFSFLSFLVHYFEYKLFFDSKNYYETQSQCKPFSIVFLCGTTEFNFMTAFLKVKIDVRI